MSSPAADSEPFDPLGHIEISTEEQSTYVLSLHGEHDLLTAPDLLEAIETMAGQGDIVIDLNPCSFIDSSVLHSIVKGHRAAVAAGRSYSLRIAAGHPLQQVIALTGIEKVLMAGYRTERTPQQTRDDA